MAQDREYHRPVMAEEVVDLMVPVPAGVVVDATFGGGGHAVRLRSALGPATGCWGSIAIQRRWRRRRGWERK
jgi:16S rRNA (cytosine1402-N4)-methyltransferase